MENKGKEYQQDEWKIVLRSEILAAMTVTPTEKEHAYGKIGYYYQNRAPASLYKYYDDTPEKFTTIKNNKMWYSAPCNFNDVFDCDIPIDSEKIFHSALTMAPCNIKQGSPTWRNLKAEVSKGIKVLSNEFVKLKKEMGVSCFSESSGSLLMWAHYAHNHRGICVEYNLLEIKNMLDFTPIPVIYSEERTCFDSLNSQNIEKDAFKVFIHSLTSKSPEWNYEKEWRIIRDQKACGDRWNTDKKGALLEMVRPKSITLGCAANPEFEQEIRDYCSSNKINLYKMEKDPIQYRINKKVILDFDKEK